MHRLEVLFCLCLLKIRLKYIYIITSKNMEMEGETIHFTRLSSRNGIKMI